jgi:4-alpha-glucanotransferase
VSGGGQCSSAARSRSSWGIGDLGDLRQLGQWSRDLGAGVLVVNPLDAADPISPPEPSPYLPSTRRFGNPIYLRVEEVPGAADLDLAALGRAGRAVKPRGPQPRHRAGGRKMSRV